ncbi:MAG: M28 family peptidase [Solirubrobacterales bacterium]|nr:M28 family peptidase [Solirubrobacterales bacterium]
MPPASDPQKPVRLILTANYDAGRMGLVYRERPRAFAALFRRALGGRLPGWLGWLAITLAALLAIAIFRQEGSKGTLIGVLQLIPTIGILLALALLIELGTSEVAPGAGDNATGAATAVALAKALDAAPPRSASVEVVLQGASDAFGIGLRKYLRARKHELRPANVVALGVAPCSAGQPRWWVSDGQFVPLRYSARIRELCSQLIQDEPDLQASPYRGRGATPALPARAAQLPAIGIGSLDARGLTPRSHQVSDTAETIDETALDTTLELGLLLVDAMDGFLARASARAAPTTAAATSPAGA